MVRHIEPERHRHSHTNRDLDKQTEIQINRVGKTDRLRNIYVARVNCMVARGTDRQTDEK